MKSSSERKLEFIASRAISGDNIPSNQLARWFWEDGLGLSAKHETEWSPELEAELEVLIERYESGVPIQYVVGRSYFYNGYIDVDPRVLIPRPETEELVREIIHDYSEESKCLRVLDIGTGSGCIAISLKQEFPDWNIVAIDVSTDALSVAQKNSEKRDVDVEYLELDLRNMNGFFEQPFDIIVSNPPYISRRERDIMDDSVLFFEPENALFASNNGMEFYSCISDILKELLKPNGSLYLEMNATKVEQIAKLFHSDTRKMELMHDMQGQLRILKLH